MFCKNNTSWFRNIFMFALVSLTLAAPTLGDEYTQYTQSVIGDMTSETEVGGSSRTDIGIGEEVECSIDPDTWFDWDCNVTLSQIEWDTIGDRVWSCTSGGEISPSGVTEDDSTTLTADMSPGSVYVHVNVHDSHSRHTDLPALAGRTFAIKAPDGDGVTVSKLSDPGHPPEGDARIRAKTVYRLRITSSSFPSVCFSNVVFREHIEAQTFDNWPNGWNNVVGDANIPFTVTEDNYRSGDDTIYDGPISKYYIYDGENYVNYEYTMNWVNQYQDENSDWQPIKNMTTTTRFQGSDKNCQMEYIGVKGIWQGPWQ